LPIDMGFEQSTTILFDLLDLIRYSQNPESGEYLYTNKSGRRSS